MSTNRRSRRTFLLVLVVAVACIALATSGCKKAEPKVEPKVAPPVIGEAGVLRAGVDMSTPPYAGQDGGRDAGIDVDVASALAGRLGLQLKLVDVKPDQAAQALKAGSVDVVMSVPLTSQTLQGASIAGTYIDDAPALFGKVETTGSMEPTVTLGSVGAAKIGAQKGSESYWILADELGEDGFTAYPELRQAFQAAGAGDIQYVGADAITGAYIARDFPGWRIVGQLAPATRLGVAVAPDATKLSDTVRATLDELAADGVLETISRKWVGEIPAFSAKSGSANP